LENKTTVCLLGSPRRDGNSDRLAARFCATAETSGSSVHSFALSEITHSGCINLFRCKTDLDHCGQRDGLTPILDAISQAQVLVLATPIYFTDVSSQLKAAIDRMFSFLVADYPTNPVKSRLSQGRSLVLVQTQGESEDRYRDLLERYSTGFNYLGFDKQYLIRAWDVREPGDVSHHDGFLQHCDATAQKVYGG
jgi:multimeric flavodoxin WrbA